MYAGIPIGFPLNSIPKKYKKMKILFLFCHLPSLNSDNGLYVQLINEFKKYGHHICVSAKGNGEEKTQIVIENRIEVLRIKSQEFTGVSSNIKKALAYQEYSIKQRFYTKRYFKNVTFDAIISHSLPPELAFIVGELKTYYKCPFYLIQSDYTWQDAVGFGYFSDKSPVAFYYRFWEKRMIKLADFIGCPTKGNFDFIRKYYPFVREEKFDLLPFWMNEIDVTPDYELKKEMGLDGKFVVVYGGSVGAAQKIEHVVELADACKAYQDIVFVILGKGPRLAIVREMVSDRGLNNVQFKDFLPQDQYLRFLATCDVGLIPLNEKTAIPNFPSKSLSYLNMRVPILAALDYVTDFGQYLEENHAGLWAHSDRIEDLKEKLLAYYNSSELRESVKEYGYKLFKEQMTTECAYRTIINKLSNIK